MATPDDRISVSKMAEIHNISRQTLIFYDKINLFHPAIVDENGYRYYKYTQIPYLREICFLKATGMKLEDIKAHIDNRDTGNTIELFQRQSELLSQEIERLAKIRRGVTHRIALYQNASKYEKLAYQPFVATLPTRSVLFFPWRTTELTRRVLHLTLMKAWITNERYDSLPPSGWGAIIQRDALNTDSPLTGAGAYVNFSSDNPAHRTRPHVLVLEGGEYACMYKYGMPYETNYIDRLIRWIEENGYEITGDVVDECLLDTTFYRGEIDADFCQLQIPVRKIADISEDAEESI